MQPRDLTCYLYLESSNTGTTQFEISIPLIRRIRPAVVTYTPEQIDNYDELMAQLNEVVDRINDFNYVSYTSNQTLNAAQRETVLTNISAVSYEAQTLQPAQQQQARANIDAVAVSVNSGVLIIE